MHRYQVFVFSAFFLVAVATNIKAEENKVCPENEIFGECESPCQPTCDKPNPSDDYCDTAGCARGCICKPGFIRNQKTNKCVLPSQCPCSKDEIMCSEHEQLDTCASPCPPTCKQPKPPACPTFTCSKGCVCKPGLIRNQDTNQCIPPSQCPKACHPCNATRNELPSTCASLCPSTCQTPCREPVFCPAVCVEGCVCKRGLIRDETTMICIKPKNCPKC